MEYRGTSLSYSSGIDATTMTTGQYIDDVVAVSNYLRERFGQEKIYLMAHSFGNYVGLNTVSEHPELFHVYIAMSQCCNQKQSELMAYEYMLEQYKLTGNEKKVKEFEKYPIRESEEAYEAYFTSMLRDTAMHELGVGTTRDMDSVITGIFWPSFKCTVYSPKERINIWRGKAFAQNTQVAQDARNFNAFEEIKSVDIPIYFFAGQYDYTCCYELQKAYYEQIQAPSKGFYTFENSAHSPLFEEPEKGVEILVGDVINE